MLHQDPHVEFQRPIFFSLVFFEQLEELVFVSQDEIALSLVGRHAQVLAQLLQDVSEVFFFVVAHLDDLFENCDHSTRRFVFRQQLVLGGELFQTDFEGDLEDFVHLVEVVQYVSDFVVLEEHDEQVLLFFARVE